MNQCTQVSVLDSETMDYNPQGFQPNTTVGISGVLFLNQHYFDGRGLCILWLLDKHPLCFQINSKYQQWKKPGLKWCSISILTVDSREIPNKGDPASASGWTQPSARQASTLGWVGPPPASWLMPTDAQEEEVDEEEAGLFTCSLSRCRPPPLPPAETASVDQPNPASSAHFYS